MRSPGVQKTFCATLIIRNITHFFKYYIILNIPYAPLFLEENYDKL